MEYEIDFLSVGNGEKSGDAIAIRCGNILDGNSSEQRIIVIDGGYKETGEVLRASRPQVTWEREAVNDLWDEEKINLLRLFRNGTFHFQKEYFSEKVFGVDTSGDFAPWLDKFHDQLGKFLSVEMLKKVPQHIRDKARKSLSEAD